MNAAIILFITEIDEMLDDLVMEVDPHWVPEKGDEKDIEGGEEAEEEVEEEGQNNQQQVMDGQGLRDRLASLETENSELRRKLGTVQDQVQILSDKMVRAEMDIKVLKPVET